MEVAVVAAAETQLLQRASDEKTSPAGLAELDVQAERAANEEVLASYREANANYATAYQRLEVKSVQLEDALAAQVADALAAAETRPMPQELQAERAAHKEIFAEYKRLSIRSVQLESAVAAACAAAKAVTAPADAEETLQAERATQEEILVAYASLWKHLDTDPRVDCRWATLLASWLTPSAAQVATWSR